MATKFPPGREADLITSASNFDAKITASAPTFGLTSAQATQFHTLLQNLITARAVAQDPLTRSPANIIAKDEKKALLIANYRLLAGIVQRFPGTTNFIRSELGLPLRNPEPSPVPVPSAAPVLQLKLTVGRTIRVRATDPANPTRRGKPPGVAGIAWFSHVGPAAPEALADWTFQGNSGRTTVDIVFPNSVAAGATVWVIAFYFNPRKQPGPNTITPLSANLPGGTVSQQAA
jgi:hypothetical protein